jgi:NADH-quinone oxidoreductase subunit L
MGLIGALLTAAYMTRTIIKTFHGEYQGEGTPHESPRIMTWPLWILSSGAILFGFLNLPKAFQVDGAVEYATRFEHYVEPTFAFPTIDHPSFNWILALSSLAVAGLGILIALQYYARESSPLKGLSRRQPFAFGYYALENKYGLDVLYTDYIVGGVKGPIARASNWVNQNVLDSIVNGVGVVTRAVAGFVYRDVDQRVVDGVVVGSGFASEESGELLRHIQTGKVQQYAAILFAAAAILAGIFVFIV